jgi:exodeoxyribonuclease VII small subunit
MAKKKELKFEEALAKLETIAQQIEEGTIGLEEAIAKYEEGMKLVKQCRTILASAEQKIQKLQPTDSGGLVAESFEPPPNGSGQDANDDAP